MCERHDSRQWSPPNDGWGTQFRVRCDLERMSYLFTSAGADRTFGTADDFEEELVSPVSVYAHPRPR